MTLSDSHKEGIQKWTIRGWWRRDGDGAWRASDTKQKYSKFLERRANCVKNRVEYVKKILFCNFWKINTKYLYKNSGHGLKIISSYHHHHHHDHHHLPPWIRSFDLFRHRRIAIVSWGVHGLFFLEVCSWGRVSGVWCCPFFQGGWFSFVCIWVSLLVFQRSLVSFLMASLFILSSLVFIYIYIYIYIY